MATLSGNKIKDTYQSLIKLTDNGNLTTGAKRITDGFGNNSPLFLSTTQIGVGVTPTVQFHASGDGKFGGNLTVIGNLIVEGSLTTVGTDTLTVKDPLIVLANNNTSSDAVDIGFYGKYRPSSTTLFAGLFRDAGDDKFKLFKSLQVEPTTTVNTSGTGYAAATLVADVEGTLTGVIASTTTATTQSQNNNSTKVATTAYVDTAGNAFLPLAGGTMSGNIAMGSNNISGGGTFTATTFSGQLSGTISSATTATTQSQGDDSTKVATTAYVDAAVTAEDLDIAGDSGTGSVDLDSQTFTIAGGTNVTTSVSNQTVTINATGAVDGSGTANDVVMWSDSDTLTDAPIAISGNNATFAGAVTGTSFSATGGFLNGSNGGIRIHTSGTKFFNVTAANAARDNIMDIGASDARFKDLFLGGSISSGTIASGDITIEDTNPNLTLSDTSTTNLIHEIKSSSDNLRFSADTNDVDAGTKIEFYTDGVERLEINSSSADFAGNVTGGNATFTNLTISATEKLRFDGAGGHTYIEEDSNDTLIFATGGTTRLTLDANATFAGNVTGTSAQFIDTSNPDGGSGAGEGGSLTVEGRRDGTANLISLRARDASAPTVALPNGQGGLIRWQGFDGSDFAQMGAIAVVADGQAVANNDAPSKMIFYTVADGGEALTTALTLDKSQNATFAGEVLVPSGDFISWGTSGHSAIEGSTVSNSLKLRTNNTVALTLDSSQDATFAGFVKAPFFTSDGGRGFKQDSVAFVSTYSNGNDANAANDIGSTSNKWRDAYFSGQVNSATISTTGNATFAGNITISKDVPVIFLTDTNSDSDYSIKNNDGVFDIRDETNGTNRLRIGSDGTVNIYNDTTFAGDVIIENSSGATLNINTALGAADSKILLHEGSTASPANGASIRYDGANNLFKIGVGTNVDTTRLTIARDTGGVGIGVTPFAHNLGTSVNVDLLGNGGIWGYAGATYVNSNAYYDSGWKYKSNGTAAALQVGGSSQILTFRQAASGTADGAITYTEAFRVHTNGNVGIGESSPESILHIKDTNAEIRVATAADGQTARIALTEDADGDTHGGYMQYVGNGDTLRLGIINAGTNTDVITMQDNFNVGIGTTSPDTLLNLEGAADTSIITLGCTKNDASWSGERIGGINFYSADGSGSGAGVRGSINYIATSTSGGSTAMTFKTGDNSEAMRIANGGSVGIGTTSPNEKLTISGNVNITGTGGYLRWNSGDMAIVNAGSYAMAFQTYTGAALTEKMRIDSSGRVGIGTDSPSSPLMIAGSGADGTAMLRLEGTAGTQTFNWISSVVYPNMTADKTIIKLFGQAQSTNNQAWIGFKYAGSGSTSNQLSFGFYANNFLFNIKATGSVGIGTESPDSYNSRGRNLVVNSSGDTGITIAAGTSNSSTLLFADGTGGTAGYRGVIEYDHSGDFMAFTTAATVRMKLDSAGTLTVSDDLVAFGSPSDKKLKENIKPIESALDKVSKLQGVTFNWKEKGITNLKQDVGFIAQDVQKVVPELVRENENGMLSMRHQGIAPILLEAIKELKAEVEELKKQIK